MHMAARQGKLRAIECLPQHKASINCKQGSKFTPLHLACAHGYFDVVQYLLEHGANMNDEKYDVTALHLALSYQHLKVVNCLLKHQANVNRERNNKVTPLHIAAENGNDGIMQSVIKHGANINSRNTSGVTPLYLPLKMVIQMQ